MVTYATHDQKIISVTQLQQDCIEIPQDTLPIFYHFLKKDVQKSVHLVDLEQL